METKSKTIPTLVVNGKDFKAIAYEKVAQYTLHGRRQGMKVASDSGVETGEDELTFTDGPKVVHFRRRWSLETAERKIRYVVADRSDRFDLKFTIYFK